jgi:hypothetical protein
VSPSGKDVLPTCSTIAPGTRLRTRLATFTKSCSDERERQAHAGHERARLLARDECELASDECEAVPKTQKPPRADVAERRRFGRFTFFRRSS